MDTRVPIKEELKKRLILGLNSRLAIGIVLGFLGCRHEALPIMQKLSHGTRAYIINEDGLQGFIEKSEILGTLAKVSGS